MKPVISCLVLLMMFILVVSCGNEEEEIIDHDIEWKDYINGTWGNVKVTKNIHMQGKTTSQERNVRLIFALYGMSSSRPVILKK